MGAGGGGRQGAEIENLARLLTGTQSPDLGFWFYPPRCAWQRIGRLPYLSILTRAGGQNFSVSTKSHRPFLPQSFNAWHIDLAE